MQRSTLVIETYPLMPILFVLFVAMPIVELALLIKVGASIGPMKTIALVLLTAVVGTYLLRREGLATLTRFNQRAQQGQLPAQEIAAGVALAAGGALLLTPGFITDAIGFSLVLPVTRGLMARWLMARFSGRVQTQFYGQRQYHQPRPPHSDQHQPLEGEFERKD